MKETLTDIIKKLSEGVYQNEEHVRLSLVSSTVSQKFCPCFWQFDFWSYALKQPWLKVLCD